MAEKKKYIGSYESLNKLTQRAKLFERIDILKDEIAKGKYPRSAQKRWAEIRLAKLRTKLKDLQAEVLKENKARAEVELKIAQKNCDTPSTD